MQVHPIDDGLEIVVSGARFHDVETTLVITRGLLQHGQREVAVALKSDGDDVVAFVVKFLRTVGKLAREGRLVSSGGLSELPKGAAPVDGFAYGAVHTVDDNVAAAGLAVADVLFAVPLRGAEVEMVHHAGAARVLARMGFAERFYPYAPWLDLDRAPVVDDADVAATVMGRQAPPPQALHGVRIEQHDSRVVVTLPRAAAVEAARAMGRGVLALASTTMGVGSTAALVYERGAKSPRAITASAPVDTTAPRAPPRTAGSFVVVVGADPGGSLVEDGFFVSCAPAEFAGVAAALAAGDSIDVDGRLGLSFRVV